MKRKATRKQLKITKLDCHAFVYLLFQEAVNSICHFLLSNNKYINNRQNKTTSHTYIDIGSKTLHFQQIFIRKSHKDVRIDQRWNTWCALTYSVSSLTLFKTSHQLHLPPILSFSSFINSIKMLLQKLNDSGYTTSYFNRRKKDVHKKNFAQNHLMVIYKCI